MLFRSVGCLLGERDGPVPELRVREHSPRGCGVPHLALGPHWLSVLEGNIILLLLMYSNKNIELLVSKTKILTSQKPCSPGHMTPWFLLDLWESRISCLYGAPTKCKDDILNIVSLLLNNCNTWMTIYNGTT